MALVVKIRSPSSIYFIFVALLAWTLNGQASVPLMLAQADVDARSNSLIIAADLSGESTGTDLDGDFDDEFDDDFDDEFGDGAPPLKISDPFESLNRGVFWINDKFYFYLLKPAAKAFRVIPEGARASISNFFSHWTTPVRFTSALLQGKVNDAGNELGRFVINTTLGVGGLFDAAKEQAGLRRKDEDFGQTFGVWGAPSGPFLMLPIFGPSNVRDGFGRLVDSSMNPFFYYMTDEEYWVVRSVEAVNDVSLDKDTYEAIKRDALDPYLFIRDAYMQNRQGKIEK